LFVSVSKFIRQYKEPFDTQKVAKFVADRDGIPVKEVLDDWEVKRQHGIRRGNAVHRYIDLTLKTGHAECNDIDHSAHCFQFRSWFKANKERYDWSNARVEYSLKDVEHKLTGKIDLVVDDLIEDMTTLIEWKTSKRFERTSQNMMLPPFDHLHDCHYSQFSLQLELYRRMYTRKSAKNADRQSKLLIVKFTSDRYEEIPAIDLSQETDLALSLRKEQIVGN